MRRASSTTDLLLDAALRTFADHGFEQATVDMMTARAGVSRGSINYHFRSKDDLFKLVLERALLVAAGWIDDLGWHLGDPAGVAAMFDSWTGMGHNPDNPCERLLSRVLVSGARAGQSQVLAAISERIDTLARRLCEPGAPPGPAETAKARLIWALWLEHVRNPLSDLDRAVLSHLLAAVGAGRSGAPA